MAKRSSIRSNVTGLKALAGNLQAMGKHRIQVGIFGNKTDRDDTTETNAEIGAKNEFGSFSEKIPARSWLRMPLQTHGKELGKTAKAESANLAAAGKLGLFLKRMGIAAEGIIQQGFRTSGWGSWAPNAPSTIEAKGSDKPLIDSAQLRRGVASRVV